MGRLPSRPCMRNTPPPVTAMAMGTKKRSVEPLSPQSREGIRRGLCAQPVTVSRSPSSFSSAPRAVRHREVAAISAESIKPDRTVVAWVSPAQIMRRCASDLEAGAASTP